MIQIRISVVEIFENANDQGKTVQKMVYPELEHKNLHTKRKIKQLCVMNEVLNNTRQYIAETLQNMVMVTVNSKNINYGAKGLCSGEHRNKDQTGTPPDPQSGRSYVDA